MVGKYAHERGLLPGNPVLATRAPRRERYVARTLSDGDVDRLLAAARERAGGRHYALFAFLVSEGLRLGEALGLRWTDIDLDAPSGPSGPTVTVHHQAEWLRETEGGGYRLSPPKSDSSLRQLPLIPTVVDALRVQKIRCKELQLAAGKRWHQAGAGGFVFPSSTGTPLSPRNVHRDFTLTLAAAGLAPVRLHDLRHSAAQTLFDHGADLKTVSAVLGHSQLSVTADLYLRGSARLLTGAFETMQTARQGTGSGAR